MSTINQNGFIKLLYKKNQKPRLFVSYWKALYKYPLKIIILHETVTDEAYKIVVIRTTNRYYSCPFTLSLIGIITPRDFSFVPGSNLQPAVSM